MKSAKMRLPAAAGGRGGVGRTLAVAAAVAAAVLQVLVPATAASAAAGGGTWSGAADLTSCSGDSCSSRWRHTATVLTDGRVLVVGGTAEDGINSPSLRSAQLYSPTTGSWSSTGGLNTARSGHTATLLRDGRVLVAGGFVGGVLTVSGTPSTNTAEIYDPLSGTWAPAGVMNSALGDRSASLLPDGRVLVAGGSASPSPGDAPAQDVEIYDPATNTWSKTGKLLVPRRGRNVAVVLARDPCGLNCGKVLAAGGDGSAFGSAGRAVPSAELFDLSAVDPVTAKPGVWTLTPPMAFEHNRHTVTVLGNGKVLVTGSYLEATGAAAELFDPTAGPTGAWTPVAPMSNARYGHSATALPDGTVLVAGGGTYVTYWGFPPIDLGAQTSTEVYDPEAGPNGSWSTVNALNEARYDHSATLLPTGRVLVSGGVGKEAACSPLCGGTGPTLSSAELYSPPSSLSVSDVSVSEGGGSATFTVNLLPAAATAVTVHYSTANGTATAGSDYLTTTSGSTPLTFAAGQTSVTLNVPILADSAPESDETFFLDLQSPSGAPIGDGRGRSLILNDDNALSVSDVSVTETATATLATFSVVLVPANHAATVAVRYATADGTATVDNGDYVPTSGTLIFSPGSTQRPVSVPVRGDIRDEPNEFFALRLSDPVAAVISGGVGTATIVDDDRPPAVAVSVNDVAVTEGNIVGPLAVFTVSLSAPLDSAVTVDFETADGTAKKLDDYVPSRGSVVFKPYTTSMPVSVEVRADVLDEPDETFSVNLSNPSANATIADTQGLGTITDDDPTPAASISIDDKGLSEGNAGVTLMPFTVRLSAPSATVVTVDFATADCTNVDGTACTDGARFTTDYVPAAGTVLFNPGTQTRTIFVEVRGDTDPEVHERFFVNLTNPSTNATITDSQAVGTILNDDS